MMAGLNGAFYVAVAVTESLIVDALYHFDEIIVAAINYLIR